MLARLRQAQITLEAQEKARQASFTHTEKVLKTRRDEHVKESKKFEEEQNQILAEKTAEAKRAQRVYIERVRKEALEIKRNAQAATSDIAKLLEKQDKLDPKDVDLDAVITSLTAEEQERVNELE